MTQRSRPSLSSAPWRRFFLVNYLLVLLVCLYVARQALLQPGSVWSLFFLLVALVGYAFVFLLPPLILSMLARLFGRWPGYGVAVTGSALMLLLLLVDGQIHDLYGFHLNGFVWNLLTTPGGFTSMGGGPDAVFSFVLFALALVVFEAGLLFWSLRKPVPRLRWGWMVTALLLCMVGERAAYGTAHFLAYRPVLNASHAVPFYQPTTFRGAAMALGFEPVRTRDKLDVADQGRLHYPRQALRVAADAPSPNIMVLVAESLRWDMLTPEIMPNLWRFAEERGIRFTDHYSGGNGTRMGIFSLFYGLPGNYWFAFLDARQPPVLMSEIQRRGYRMGLYTSARFSYPEFDKTVFADVPESLLHSDEEGPGWQRDRRNVDRMLSFLDQRDAAKPFFGFLFFESPHARYYFPEESVIRPDYLKNFNYATMDLEQDIGGIFNRYVNASHHLDQQLGRLLDGMAERNLLDNTILVITGDHGEEFMENGRWGHNSEFHNQQVHVPLVLAGPGIAPAVVDKPTSHLDLAPTLLSRLGVENEPRDYAVGVPLDQVPDDRYRLAASWDAVAYLGPEYKVAMPVRAGGLFEMAVSRADDTPVKDEDAVMARLQSRLVEVLGDMSRFFSGGR